ncbi:hypothetical protein BDZ91DRAFT_310310 [Kalaharituber pfeilii]|nr:hypothetical protein BDZ91DRAFT_310310 [Kalaharituber pfeilii]
MYLLRASGYSNLISGAMPAAMARLSKAWPSLLSLLISFMLGYTIYGYARFIYFFEVFLFRLSTGVAERSSFDVVIGNWDVHVPAASEFANSNAHMRRLRARASMPSPYAVHRIHQYRQSLHTKCRPSVHFSAERNCLHDRHCLCRQHTEATTRRMNVPEGPYIYRRDR